MRNLIAAPLLALAVIVQTAIISQFPLLGGMADLVLVVLAAWSLQENVTTAFHWAMLAAVMVSLVSRLPWFIYAFAYLITVLLAILLQRRIWQVPMLAMFSVTFLGTLVLNGMSIAYLSVSGQPPDLTESLGIVALPSVLLNMLLAIPVFGTMRDVAIWVFGPPEAA
jgi:hypothetical protein